MGGSGGVIVVQKAVVDALTDPTVHGNLPHTMRLAVDPILSHDPNKWSENDCGILAEAIKWSLCHLT